MRSVKVERAQLVDVADLAGRYRVLWHHCRDGRACAGDPGLPDLVIAGPAGVLFRELKSSRIGMRPEQTQWRLSLRAAGVDFGVWLPSHFRAGVVEREIAALA